jgi:hypothetical protein
MSARYVHVLCRSLDEDGEIKEEVLAIEVDSYSFRALCKHGYNEDSHLVLDIVESGY